MFSFGSYVEDSVNMHVVHTAQACTHTQRSEKNLMYYIQKIEFGTYRSARLWLSLEN